jgi:phage regulator Rha-like protein
MPEQLQQQQQQQAVSKRMRASLKSQENEEKRSSHDRTDHFHDQKQAAAGTYDQNEQLPEVLMHTLLLTYNLMVSLCVQTSTSQIIWRFA